MKKGFEKYVPFEPIKMENRDWPKNALKQAPIWCSVDLRDGNQALVNPMSKEQKLRFFQELIKMGFKEIEVGFPSSNDIEFEICRELIEKKYIPDDVTIQVLVQAREHLIKRTFEALRGAKNVILHFYNSTSALQRKVVFKKDKEGIKQIAEKAAYVIKELSSRPDLDIENLRFEYSPESFSNTETDFAIDVCDCVMNILESDSRNPLILNLPNTVEVNTPNVYADQVEYFIKNMKNREGAIISIHPHNDRGTGVAGAELAMLAGAQRVEGTLFGNGERTGNLDIVNLALNLYTQGIDPKLDFSELPKLRELYESSTGMLVHQRHPYAGELVFTAFSGSHQDAINKGKAYMKEHDSDYWEIPYLPIDPADVGRAYEPIIRINNQSGKGGAAYIMDSFGYHMPKEMHPDFGQIVTKYCDEIGTEISANNIRKLFIDNYINSNIPYSIIKQKVYEDEEYSSKVHFKGCIQTLEGEKQVDGLGNGPIDAFFNAIKKLHLDEYHFVNYSEHAISKGSDSQGVAYIELKDSQGDSIFGVGQAHNINHAANLAVMSAINRALQKQEKFD